MVTVFWLLFFIDRELIYPARLDAVIPQWVNHVMHTVPLVTVLIDTRLNNHTYNTYGINGLVFTIIYNLAYAVL